MNEKIARYQEIERRGLLDKLSTEKRAMWEEYKSRHPELSNKAGLTSEQYHVIFHPTELSGVFLFRFASQMDIS